MNSTIIRSNTINNNTDKKECAVMQGNLDLMVNANLEFAG